ncbi:MAG: MFS transporter [Acidimicrobiaceae bacterium]|nr:MFS transporter [Acidimicrobiaceae bacterium]
MTTTRPVSSPTAGTGYTHRQILVIMSGLMLGMLLAALDQTIVSTALTTISRDFHRPDLYSWVVTSYLLTSTVTTPLYGKISDLFGRKRIFQFTIVLFLAGSALSGLAGSMYQLIVFRGIQGLGAGGLMALALSIVGDVIPPRERGRYQGYFGGVFGAASVLGPLIGGFLVDEASWRWVFYVNLPIGVVALVVINRVLHLDHQAKRAQIDWTGAVLLVTGVALFLVGVQTAGEHASLTTAAMVYGAVGLVLVGAFLWWEAKHAAEPILPLRLFRNPVFSVSLALTFLTGAIMLGAIIFLPQYMQTVRGVSPTVSGLRLLPMLAGMLITSIASGRLMTKTGRYKVFIVAGNGVLVVGIFLFSLLTVTTSFWVFSGMLFLAGFGLGLFMQMLVVAVQNGLPQSEMGVGTSAVMFFRTLGGAVGASVLGAILIESERNALTHEIARHGGRLGPLYAYTHGMDHAYLWAVPGAIISFVLAFFLREIKLRSASDISARPLEPPEPAEL